MRTYLVVMDETQEAEVALHYESAAHQDLEGAIDGRGADHDAEHRELTLDVVGREVAVAAEDHARDGFAL